MLNTRLYGRNEETKTENFNMIEINLNRSSLSPDVDLNRIINYENLNEIDNSDDEDADASNNNEDVLFNRLNNKEKTQTKNRYGSKNETNGIVY